MKHFYILQIAIKNLFNHKFQTLSIILPLSFIIAIVSALSFFFDAVEKDALMAANSFPDILVQQQVGGRTESLFFDKYEDVLDKIKGIKSFFPRVWGYINYTDKNNNSKAFVVMGLDPNLLNKGNTIEITIEQGRTLKNGDTHRGIMGKALARALNCNIGDTAQITTSDMRRKVPIEVIGIFDASVQIYTADLLLVDLKTAKEILCFYSENESSDIPVYLTNPLMANNIAQQISAEIDGARPLTKSIMLNLTKQSFGQKSGFFYLIWIVFLANLILIAWSLMSQISFNLQKEIGILKAIGWDTGDIMKLKTMETFFIGAFSVMSGIIIGISYMFINAPGLKKLIIGWADIYPDFPIPLYIEKTTVLLIVVLGILPLLIGTIIPIWKIGIIDPDEAIRK